MNFTVRPIGPRRPVRLLEGYILGSLAVLLSCPLPARTEDWPQWRGPDRNGISKESGWMSQWPAGGPKELWRASVGIGWSSVSVSQSRVYTMGNVDETDHVFC